MRLSRSTSAETLGFNMTSMIDIVFLLIIFFMAVSHLSRTQDASLNLVEVSSGSKKVESSFILNVDREQRILIGSREVTIDEVLNRLSEEIQNLGGDPDRLVLRVRFDRQQDSVRMNELMTQVSQLGITDIQLSVVQR